MLCIRERSGLSGTRADAKQNLSSVVVLVLVLVDVDVVGVCFHSYLYV